MQDSAAAVAPEKERPLILTRFYWFLAGATVNYLLISTPMKWLKTHTTLPQALIIGCSLAVSTSFFFCWNYFVNFRTNARRRDVLPRYAAAVGLMYCLSWLLLFCLKQFNANMSFAVGGHAIDLDIVATQFFLSGLKFFLYHVWVFPAPPAATPAP